MSGVCQILLSVQVFPVQFLEIIKGENYLEYIPPTQHANEGQQAEKVSKWTGFFIPRSKINFSLKAFLHN